MTIHRTSHDTLSQNIQSIHDHLNAFVEMSPELITDENKNAIAQELSKLRQLQMQVRDYLLGKPSRFADLSQLEVKATMRRFSEMNELIDQHTLLLVGDIAAQSMVNSDSEAEEVDAYLDNSDSEAEEVVAYRASSGSEEEMVFSFDKENLPPVPFLRNPISSSASASESEENDATRVATTPLVKEIQGLQELIPLLLNDSSNSFEEVAKKWEELEPEGEAIHFQLSKRRPATITDRIGYHLYCIHKHEKPDQLVPDIEYGRKAMIGVLPATNAERIRALQRGFVEADLECLELALNVSDENAIQSLLLKFEELKLDPKDALPSGETAPAKELFCKFINLHYNNSNAFFPDRDLARWAFYRDTPAFRKETKIQAIQGIRQALGTAWKLL